MDLLASYGIQTVSHGSVAYAWNMLWGVNRGAASLEASFTREGLIKKFGLFCHINLGDGSQQVAASRRYGVSQVATA